jgi:hypothetical protein
MMLKTLAVSLATLTIAQGQLAEKAHPRLWFPVVDEAAMRENIARDPLAARLQSAIMNQAATVLEKRTCRYDIPDGKRLLTESRLALHNILHTTWAWRMGGGEAYRLRAIAELDAACALKDWNPSHFLDTAEMATAVAVGYDWLHGTLSPQQLSTYRSAIIEKALKPAQAIFQKKSGWAMPRNNWSQVCGAGIALGAAAIAEPNAPENSALSEELFTQGLELVQACGKFYRPDGMYPEGPGYWHYGTNFHVMMLAACAPLDIPLTDDPVLRRAGDAIMHLSSSTGVSFNFADGNPSRSVPSAAQAWIARHYGDPAQAAYIRTELSGRLDQGKGKIAGDRWFPLTLLWLPPAPPESTRIPLAATFGGEQSVAIFRTGWANQDAWLAIKGGTPASNHGHMDVGSFVYDVHGQRWFHDMGSENYNLPGYFGKSRWSYYRLQNRSHNTLEIHGNLQNAHSKPCPLIHSSLAGDSLVATFDLTAAYQGSATQVIRSASFDKTLGATRIEDVITAPTGDVVWRGLTDAEITISGPIATLRKAGRQIRICRLSPTGTWSIAAATPPLKTEKPNENFRVLVLTVPQAPQLSIRVEIRP